MKRVYHQVRVVHAGGGWSILLDARLLQTPANLPLALPCRALAEAIAGEWDAQTETIVPARMPLMRLAATAIDRVGRQPRPVIDEIVGYAATDLVCYRAERPAELAARQHAVWQPLVEWARLRFGAPLQVVAGIVPQPLSPAAVAALRSAVDALDPFWLTALHSATTACGSVVIGLALVEGRLDAGGAWRASQLDETYQMEKWGEDAEAAARRRELRADLDATACFMELLRS